MAYDEYRERRRFEDENRDLGSEESRYRSGSESRWPGESSWGYGREYDEGFSATSRRRELERGSEFERGERSQLSGRQLGHRPRYGERVSRIGWTPQGGYGQSSIYLYGTSQDPGLLEPTSWRPYGWEGAGEYYGASSHLANIPRGRYTGRGPKGYQRSDERIREDISEELAQSGGIDASNIEVVVSRCEVTLTGEVDTRDEKRLAEDIAEAAPGVRHVNNDLKVKKGFFARLFGVDDEEDEERKERYGKESY